MSVIGPRPLLVEYLPYYTSYGLDIVGFHNEKDYISHREFILNRYDGNNRFITSHTGEYNYITLKYYFDAKSYKAVEQ